MPDTERPLAWRQRAEQLRAFAEQASDVVVRQQLHELADTWDQMAERAERRLKADVIRLRG